jgi:hypothetical protein
VNAVVHQDFRLSMTAAVREVDDDLDAAVKRTR